MLTKRGTSVTSSILAFFILAFITSYPMFIIASLTLILIVTIDSIKFRIALHSVRKLRIKRELETSKAIVNSKVKAYLDVEHPGSIISYFVEINDNLPKGLIVKNDSNLIWINIGKKVKERLSYEFEVLEVGKKVIGPITLKIVDTLGLFYQIQNIDLKSEIKIQPTIGKGVIELYSVRALAIRLAEKGVSRKKYGTEFLGIREYVTGDDHRLIAWKAMAKSPTYTPMTKEQEEKKILDFVIALLLTPSLNEGEEGKRKLDKIAEGVIEVLKYALRDGYNSLFVYNQKDTIASVKGDLREVSNAIASFDLAEVKEERNKYLDSMVSYLEYHLKKKSLIILVIDYPYPYKLRLNELLRLKASGHYVKPLVITTTSFVKIDDKKKVGRLIKEVQRKHEEGLVKWLNSIGILAQICGYDDLLPKMVTSFVEAKRIAMR